MAIPKAGAHSVGVEESFRFDLGRVVNSQQAYGVSLANEQLKARRSNWGLNLPAEWLENAERRRRARIPDDAAAMSVEAGAVPTAAELADAAWGLRRSAGGPGRPHPGLPRPSGGDLAPGNPVRHARRRDDPCARLLHPGQSGAGKQLFQARQLVERGKKLSKPVCWVDPEYSITRSVLVSGTRVTMPAVRRPGMPAPPDQPLTLVGGWPMQRRVARALGCPIPWTYHRPRRCAWGGGPGRASKDFTEVSTRVGMRGFSRTLLRRLAPPCDALLRGARDPGALLGTPAAPRRVT